MLPDDFNLVLARFVGEDSCGTEIITEGVLAVVGCLLDVVDLLCVLVIDETLHAFRDTSEYKNVSASVDKVLSIGSTESNAVSVSSLLRWIGQDDVDLSRLLVCCGFNHSVRKIFYAN